MSLLWPRLHIALAPGHVAVADGRTHRDAAVDSPGWAGALKALKGLLSDASLRGRASIKLSHHFAGVHCLTPPPVRLKAAEMQGWILDTLERQYGEAGRGWQVAWQMKPPGKPFLVASISAALLEELEEVLHGMSIRPAAVQPWFTASWNRNQGRLGKGQVWYVLAEPGRLMLANAAGGEIRSLRTVSMEDDPQAQLAALIQREALLNGESSNAPVWVDSVLLGGDWRALGQNRVVQLLPATDKPLASMMEN